MEETTGRATAPLEPQRDFVIMREVGALAMDPGIPQGH
jgi:hypothetical protein